MKDAVIESSVKLPSEVASLLIPMFDRPLLLPNVAVAEIIPYVEAVEDYATPDWHVGTVEWRRVNIPLLSVEALSGRPMPEVGEDARIAVINGVGDHTKLPFYAFVVAGIPRLVRVIEQEIGKEDKETGPAEKMFVQVSGEHAVILDLDFIEEKILGH
ncbi:MAG: chemotaxis protein CheW [Pseudomonadales bacterium]|nr:chemotaxis protein CheW [Pseudomonadales bacterium]